MINKLLCWLFGHKEYEAMRFDCWYLYKCARKGCNHERTEGPCEECLKND